MPIVDYLLDDVGDPGVARSSGRWSGRGSCRDRIARRTRSRCSRRRATGAPRRADRQTIPGLLDVEAWRLFEVEGGGEDSLANHEKFFGDTWGDAFRELAARRSGRCASGCST